jgi:hypothetical protein
MDWVTGTAWPYMDAHGSGMAALAALLGIPVLLWQIFQNSRLERRRLKRRYLAALATSPMAVNDVLDWVKKATTAMAGLSLDPTIGQQRIDPPPFPLKLIESIERLIEATPRSQIARTLAAIVSDIQVLRARMSDPDAFKPKKHGARADDLDDNLLLAASIYTRAESLLEPARRISDDLPLDFDGMGNALFLMGVRKGRFESTHAMLEERRARASPSRMRWLLDWRRRRARGGRKDA